MRQPPDWLAEEERLELLAKARVLAGGGSAGLQRKNQRRAAGEYAAVVMVIIFLGLMCWNWNSWTPAEDRSEQTEYKNAFYRALDGGPRPTTTYVLSRTEYPPGLMPEIMSPTTPLDRLLLPADGSSLQIWLEGNDAGRPHPDNSLKLISLVPPEPGRKRKKAWIPVRDLMRETPRGID